MPRIGYACVSTLDQDHATQEARLKAAGCEVIRAEKASGKGGEGRDELASILEFIRADGREAGSTGPLDPLKLPQALGLLLRRRSVTPQGVQVLLVGQDHAGVVANMATMILAPARYRGGFAPMAGLISAARYVPDP
jgi:hypothetical protein